MLTCSFYCTLNNNLFIKVATESLSEQWQNTEFVWVLILNGATKCVFKSRKINAFYHPARVVEGP